MAHDGDFLCLPWLRNMADLDLTARNIPVSRTVDTLVCVVWCRGNHSIEYAGLIFTISVPLKVWSLEFISQNGIIHDAQTTKRECQIRCGKTYIDDRVSNFIFDCFSAWPCAASTGGFTNMIHLASYTGCVTETSTRACTAGRYII